MRYLLVLLLLSALTPLAWSTSERPTHVLHYRARHSMMLVTVAIDGKNRILIFDTGAEQTMIHFPQVSGGQEMALWQHNYAYVKQRSNVRLGEQTFLIEVIKVNLTGTSLLKVADGVLGQDVLSNFATIRINYRQQTIELFES